MCLYALMKRISAEVTQPKFYCMVQQQSLTFPGSAEIDDSQKYLGGPEIPVLVIGPTTCCGSSNENILLGCQLCVCV